MAKKSNKGSFYIPKGKLSMGPGVPTKKVSARELFKYLNGKMR